MANAKSTTPALRFKGFDAEWEERQLGDIAEKVTRTDPSSTAPVMMITADNGFIKQSDRYAFNNSGQSLTKYIVLKRKELAYNHGASKLRPYGSCFALPYKEARVPFVYHCFSIDNDSPDFISIQLNGTAVEAELRKIVSSGARMDGLLNISYEAYSKVPISLPNPDEQGVVANYFNHLDNLIALQRRKLVKLQNVKKAMLQKMFPTRGSTIPQIRFAGFTEPWERQKLLDTVDKVIDFRGRTPKKLGMDWSESGYLALSALNVKNGYIDLSIDAHYGDDALYDAWMAGNELRKGQVLFTTEAPMGNVAQVPDDKRYILSQRTIAFVVNKAVITDNFLATVLRTPTSVSELTTLSSGGTAKGVSQKSLSSFHIPVPTDMKEQEKIAMLFQDFDNRIVLQQHKVENLQNVKKACLQRMFA